MTQRQGAWIDVYPLRKKGQRILRVINSNSQIALNKELSNYCEESWKPKAEKGWKSSWIAFAKKIDFGLSGKGDYLVNVDAGAMPFYVVDGVNQAIEQGKDFAPEKGYVNCLSVGFPTATKDGKVIYQRRAPDVHCPNILIHEPCGYMASMMFAPRNECDDPKYANDQRLFDLALQLDARKKEIADTFGLSEEDVDYDSEQDLLACGWKTTEMYFSTIGKMNATERELTKPEDQEFFFVPFEHLKELIYNQGKLSQVDATNYRPEDPRQIPLIDESLVGLIWGFEKLTGEKLDIPETIDRLNKDGLEIKVHDTSPGTSYEFPTSF